MKKRVFLDTNVFIYSWEFPASNSAILIELLNKGLIDAVTSERVLKEIAAYFEKYHSIKLARKFRRYIIDTCTIVLHEKVIEEMNKFRGTIKEKDLEQLATVKKLGIKFLVAYDRDFDNFEEYVTPKQFLAIMDVKTVQTEF